MNALFTFEVLIVAVLVVAVVVGGAYAVIAARQRDRAPDREEEPEGATTAAAPPPREYYKSMGLETTEEMKIRLYSLDEYREDIGGDAEASRSGRFVAALKAYRQLDDDWYDYPPNRAADVLELTPEDYEVDDERGVLLLRRFPPGLPVSSRDV